MNKAATTIWWDDINRDSYLLCEEPYKIEILRAEPVNEAEVEIVVYGTEENVDRFLEDLDEGDINGLDDGTRDDDEYKEWLDYEVKRLKSKKSK